MQTLIVVVGIVVFAVVIYNVFFNSSDTKQSKEETLPTVGAADPTDPVFIDQPEQQKPVLVSDEDLPKAEIVVISPKFPVETPIAEPVKEQVVEADVQPDEPPVKEQKPKKEKSLPIVKVQKAEEKSKQKTKKEDDKPVKKSKNK